MTIPALIMVAPNGARRTKADHPQLPIGPEDLARTAVACRDAGANAIHLHVRDRDNTHSLDADLYRQAVDAVRVAVGEDFVIQITTESVGIYDPEQQMASIRQVRPQAFSAAIRELVPDANHERAAADFFSWAASERIATQFILYTPDDLDLYADLAKRGLIHARTHSLLFVLGRYTQGQESDASDLRPFLDRLDRSGLTGTIHWMVCAFGHGETQGVAASLCLGGNARVGFENSLWHPDGSLVKDNAQKVAVCRSFADILGLSNPDTETALQLLGGD